MKITTRFMTSNDCYRTGQKIVPKGIMVHSTATPGVMAAAWYSQWNKPGVSKCVHAFLDDNEVIQYLPWNYRGWHAGGSANNNYIGFEICEPKDLNDKDYFAKAYKTAVELTVMLCRKYGLTEKNVICHSEGYKKGIASNHADVMHWFPKHGKSMDTFREDVRAKLTEQTKPKPKPAPPNTTAKIKYPGTLLKKGTRGSNVKLIQNRLNSLGFNCGKADGIFGDKTLAAVIAFQKSKKLTTDGIVGPATWTKLFN